MQRITWLSILNGTPQKFNYYVVMWLWDYYFAFASSNNWACAVKHVTLVQHRYSIGVPFFHRRNDTPIGSVQSISLPHPCGLWQEAQKRNGRIFQRSFHHDNSPKGRTLRLFKKAQILFSSIDLRTTIFHLIYSYTNMWRSWRSYQPKGWKF